MHVNDLVTPGTRARRDCGATPARLGAAAVRGGRVKLEER